MNNVQLSLSDQFVDSPKLHALLCVDNFRRNKILISVCSLYRLNSISAKSTTEKSWNIA